MWCCLSRVRKAIGIERRTEFSVVVRKSIGIVEENGIGCGAASHEVAKPSELSRRTELSVVQSHRNCRRVSVVLSGNVRERELAQKPTNQH